MHSTVSKVLFRRDPNGILASASFNCFLMLWHYALVLSKVNLNYVMIFLKESIFLIQIT